MKKILFVLGLVILIGGCALTSGEEVEVGDDLCGSGKITAKVKSNMGSEQYCVEIADDHKSRGKGLMYRESMPEDEGMLFVFEEVEPVSFWMKNTYIALDLLYFDENKNLVDMKDNFQPCEKAPCDSFHTEQNVKYVLEVNENQFETSILEKEYILEVEGY